MKKIVSIFTLAAFFFAAAVSCTKEADVPAEEQGQEEEVTPVNPAEPGEDENLPEGMIRLTFSLSSESDSPAGPAGAPASRTSWDGSTQSWTDGDHIRIIWGEGDVEGTDYVDAEVVSGTVSAVVADSDYYYAVYPTTASYTYTAAEGKVTITVPRYQTGNFSDANIMAAKTGKAEASFAFKNMTSILKFSTGSTYSYNSASFMANDKSVKLTGEVATTFPGEFAVNTTNESMKEDIVCIQPNNPAGNAGLTANTTYYLAMLPGAAIANGIGFKIETRSGSSVDLIAGGLSKSSFSRERTHVYDLGTLDSRIITDWYISEGGTGDGNLEADPAGPERLMDLLNPSYSASNTTAGWRLANATIHVAPGSYNIQALNGGEVFDPHYNLSGLVAHVKGEGTALNPTKFICNETNGDRIFALTGTHRVGNFTFENITFTATNLSATDGVAFYLTSTGVNGDEHNVITFKDCTFTGLTSTVSSGSGYGGAAVNIYDSADFDVFFNGCTFSNNTAVRGGAIALTNGGENSNVSFKDCTFANNVATTNQGGAIYIYANGKATFDGTSFAGDGTTNNALNGGALAVMKGASATLQNGCSFTNCVTSAQGGAIFNHGSITVNGTSFSGCKAANAGAIQTDGYADIGIDAACTFTNNVATTNAGSIRFQKTDSGADTPTLTVKNSTFQGDGSTTNAVLGGAIDVASASLEPVIDNCSFSSLKVTSGGAIRSIGLLSVANCSFLNNTATSKGSAVYSYGSAGNIAKAVIINSLFKGNESTPTDGSGSNQKGCTLLTGNYSYMLAANSTFTGNIEHSKSHGIISPETNTSNIAYVVSCTFSENLYSDGSSTSAGPDIARTTSYIKVYNTISTNTTPDIANVVRQNSIFTLRRFTTNKSTYVDMDAFALGTYSDSKGVYPLNSTYATGEKGGYNDGMTVEAIQELTYDSNLTLTDAQKALLAADQKGNPRGGTIMGAYVLTD